MSTTIAAVSTPSGAAGLGVVRLSGPEALTVADGVFRSVNTHKQLKTMSGYTAAYGHVFDEDGAVDECVALVFRAPHSYTGEDVVEFSCHGGRYLLQRVLRACLAQGAVPAGPGEFTRRAFLNGKMDLTQAESVMGLIAAEGRLAAGTALAAREGAVYCRLESIKNALLRVNARFGAYIDYPDEDIPELSPIALSHTVEESVAALTALLSTFDAGRVLREGIDTAIVGSPNVGKSTLMNCLAGCQRSIVTDIAGTTRDVVEETVRVGEVTLRLADTAGLRETGDTVESVGVELARQRMEQAALVIAVFDGAQPLSEEDKVLADSLSGRTAVAVVNKADKPQAADAEWLRERFSHVVNLSAKENTGVEALTAAVTELTGVGRLDAAQPVLTTERQRQCAATALACLEEAAAALAGGFTLDAVSVSIDGALNAILELTGERATEAVVDQVFADFCVGK